MFSVVVNCDIILVQYVHLPNSWKSTITDYGFCKVFSKILPFSNKIISNFKLFEITVNFFEYVLHLIHRSQNSILWHFFSISRTQCTVFFWKMLLQSSCYSPLTMLLLQDCRKKIPQIFSLDLFGQLVKWSACFCVGVHKNWRPIILVHVTLMPYSSRPFNTECLNFFIELNVN